MSTPDLSGPPTELQVGAGQLPHLGEIPTTGAPSPGIAVAAARLPGGPTASDGNPQDLAVLIAQFANSVFQAPVAPPDLPATSGSLAGGAGSLTPPTGFSPATSVPVLPGADAVPDASVSQASLPEGLSVVPASIAPPLSAGAPPSSPPSAAAPTAPVSAAPVSAGSVAPSNPFDAPLSFGALDGFSADLSAPLGSAPLGSGVSDPGLSPSDALYWAPTSGSAPAASSPGAAPARAAPAQAAPAQATTAEPTPATGRSWELEPSAAPRTSKDPFDAHAIKRQFPILSERVNGKPLVWLDNAATTQKPQAVIDRLTYYYEHENSNIHRAAHTLAARATDAYENARETVRRFINAPSKNDIIFVRGATEGINLVAQSWGRRNVRAGDEIVLTELEHHANIVPWHRLCSETGAKLRIVPTDSRGVLILEEYEKLLCDKTRLVAFTQVSNALGTITPAAEMIALAHRYGARVLLDGAQAVSHKAVDVQALDCDFYVFSGHKVFAPTGIGVVFGKKDVLEVMPPWQGGGNMIQDVTFERIVYQGPPARFEAGTGNIADAVGLGAALDWLTQVGVHNVERYEHELLVYGTERLQTVPGLRLVGTAPEKAGVLSFVLDGQKTEEVGGLLDQEGIAVRSGHHCAQPILRRFGLEATVRASLAPYNTYGDVDALVSALHRLQAGQIGRNGAK